MVSSQNLHGLDRKDYHIWADSTSLLSRIKRHLSLHKFLFPFQLTDLRYKVSTRYFPLAYLKNYLGGGVYIGKTRNNLNAQTIRNELKYSIPKILCTITFMLCKNI